MPIISILFSAIVTIVILHSYTDYSSVVIILPVLCCNYLLFRFCAYCKRKSRVFYLLALSVVVALILWLANYAIYDRTFFEWLYINFSNQDYTWYFIGFFVFCCFAFSSLVYYFTVVVYRSLFLFVVLLIPYSLNYTRLVDVPAIYTILAIGLYFALMVYYGKKELRSNVIDVKNKHLLAFTAAVCLVVSLSFLIELPESERQQMGDLPGLSGASGLLENNLYSGVSDASQNNDEVLFLVEADEQLYFIRQVFIRYGGELWELDPGNELNRGPLDWEEPAEAMNFDRLFALAIEADDAGQLYNPLEYREIMENLTNLERVKTATIIPQGNNSTAYILAPPRTFSLSGLPSGVRHVRNRLGEILIADRYRAILPYTVAYYSDIFRGNPDFQRLAHQGADDFDNLLRDLLMYAYRNHYEDADAYNENITNDMVMRFITERADAERIAEHIHDFQSVRIRNLAMGVTDGLDSDYEKAAAIERYFFEAGYKYDSDSAFAEANLNIEHFIFESQSGTCGHYATAMALMARSIGLNARYVEGFTSTEQNEEGLYVIRAKNSHAFVQVYIPLYGWVTFDPTVPSDEDDSSFFEFITTTSAEIFAALSLLILAWLAGYFAYTRIIKEMLFRRKAAKASGSEGVILIYSKILELARLKLDVNNISAASLVQVISARYQIDIESIASCFERAYFGAEAIQDEEKESAFELYKRLYASMHNSLLNRRA